jgi:hypothetical protein
MTNPVGVKHPSPFDYFHIKLPDNGCGEITNRMFHKMVVPPGISVVYTSTKSPEAPYFLPTMNHPL